MKTIRMILMAAATAGCICAQAATTLVFESEIPALCAVGQALQVSGRVRNTSNETITGFRLAMSIGGETYTRDFSSNAIRPGESAGVNWTIGYIPSETANVPYTLTLGGDASDDTSYSSTLHVRERRWIVEEGTGTWCSACPMGIYVFEQMKEKLGDKFIGIALHPYGSDPMGVANYQIEMLVGSSVGIPYTFVNRVRGCTPQQLEEELQKLSRKSLRASIEEARCELSPDRKSVTVSTAVMFDKNYTPSQAEMRIGYFIIENDVHVPGNNDYNQTNGYSGHEGSLPGWDDKPAVIPSSQMWYQHVARGYSENVYGVAGSVPADITAGEVYTYEHSFDLPDNILVPDNCRLVAMVIERNTGTVLNGIEVGIDGGIYTDVAEMPSDCDTATPAYYNLDGVRADAGNLAPGIYVEVRGTVRRKIVVR